MKRFIITGPSKAINGIVNISGAKNSCLPLMAASILFKKEVIFLYLSLLIFFTNFFISFFHSLVERKLISYDAGCSSSNENFEDIESLRMSLENTPIAKCDEITFSILGLSLANINLIILIFFIFINILFIIKK